MGEATLMSREAQKTYTNKYAKQAHPRLLKWLLHQPAVGVAVHWLFQSMLYMDATERWFKIGLDIGLTGLGTIILQRWLPWSTAVGGALFIAHTINFLCNAQLWVVLKHYGLVHNSRDYFQTYAESMADRVRRQSCFRYAAMYGSISRSEWKPSSDLDLRLVRYAGWRNGFSACLFVMKERTRALVARFPLDVYVLDDQQNLEHMRTDEVPIVLT